MAPAFLVGAPRLAADLVFIYCRYHCFGVAASRPETVDDGALVSGIILLW